MHILSAPQKPATTQYAGSARSHRCSRQEIRTHCAYARSDVIHKDINMAMIYDSFTITVLVTLESLGFCKKGEGGSFIQNGRIGLGGELPINTDGGGLSSNHPGMRGIFLVIEATKQLRGECGDRQVKNCQLAFCHGTGGTLGLGTVAQA